jgi:hypothetical protein
MEYFVELLQMIHLRVKGVNGREAAPPENAKVAVKICKSRKHMRLGGSTTMSVRFTKKFLGVLMAEPMNAGKRLVNRQFVPTLLALGMS